MLTYQLPDNVLAFTTSRMCPGGQFGIDARIVGIEEDDVCIKPSRLVIPRQTHSVNVAHVESIDVPFPIEIPDTDAVFTTTPGLCVAVKTADCIPVLLYDERQHAVAAIHAGWRGTVGHIVSRTIEAMQSNGQDLHAIIGPGISLQAFEVGDEVYEAFAAAGFPMARIAQRYAKWHLDLWDANRWLLEQCGVTNIHTSGICTFNNTATLYSARVETINTGRNINGIMLPLP